MFRLFCVQYLFWMQRSDALSLLTFSRLRSVSRPADGTQGVSARPPPLLLFLQRIQIIPCVQILQRIQTLSNINTSLPPLWHHQNTEANINGDTPNSSLPRASEGNGAGGNSKSSSKDTSAGTSGTGRPRGRPSGGKRTNSGRFGSRGRAASRR